MKKPFGDERLDEHKKTDWCSQENLPRAERQSGRPWRAPGASPLALRNLLFCAALLFSLESGARAQQRPVDLTTVSIEDLMQLQVTSASKRQERFCEAAAAIYVITQEDIRRSGATSIPELLRMVPGLNVAQLDANKWAISSRGFSDLFATKMLVLLDGRSVYTPLFSGVFWDVQDTLLEDIERIEVIRGPGAALWGANAVNGVINIITKAAKDTQGGLVTAGAGNQEHGFGAVRYGGAIGDNIHYRFFAKYFNRDRLVDATGRPTADGWSITRGGYRVDWQASAQDSVTVQGDFYGGNTGGTVTRPISLSPLYESTFEDRVQLGGGNILTRWHHASSARSDTTLQVYFDRTSRNSPIYGENRNTIDIDFQHHLLLGERHEIVWGGGYRYTAGHIGERFGIAFHPPERGDNLFSGFVQDEITVVPDRLHIIFGSKIEHNDYTRFEVQPSLRLLWTPEKRQTVWAAVSRAVRMPSWSQFNSETILAVFPGPGGLANVITVFGNPASKSEQLIAFELGYRIQKSRRLWIDAAAYYNIYDHLQTGETGSPFVQTTPPPPHVTIPVRFDNKLNGTTYGLELAANWQPVGYWRLSGGYTLQRQRLRSDPSSTAVNPFPAAGDSSKNQFSVRSQLNLPHSAEIDVSFYFVGKLIYRETPAYTRSDVRLGWHPAERLELSLVGQNLLRPRHAEFADSLLGDRSTQVRRAVYGKVTWRF